MSSSNHSKENGGSASHSHRHEKNSEDDTSRPKPSHWYSLRGLIRSESLNISSESNSQNQDHHNREGLHRSNTSRKERHPYHPPKPSRSLSLDDGKKITISKPLPPASAAPPAPPLPVQVRPNGTRGLYVPAYGNPEHFGQPQRVANPTVRLPTSSEQRSEHGSKAVVVRFFHCENMNFSRESLVSPDVKELVSAAASFIGECQLNDTPQSLQPRRPNNAYRGLTLESSHGGSHLHFPDVAGLHRFSGNIEVDWNYIVKAHMRKFPRTVLLVGVGLGEPGQQCA